ncbi:hypothetical protein [Marinobacter halodurans]|uniref:hypothetical protein n=1 Tax=Marinobacter halodurans TaxID=2528979 RepID=UPI0013F17E88|nr:hypothetical protein [Marinobacter halodurans]
MRGIKKPLPNEFGKVALKINKGPFPFLVAHPPENLDKFPMAANGFQSFDGRFATGMGPWGGSPGP